MGGLGHHAVHPYAVQTSAFIFAMVLPGGVFGLLLGSWWETRRRTLGARHTRTAEARALTVARYATLQD